jgi:hypothetical protein
MGLDTCKALGKRHEPQARRRTAALMQSGNEILGRLGKHLRGGSEIFDAGAEEQDQFAQPLRTYGRGDRGEPSRVDCI